MKKIREIYQSYMLRPMIYKAVTRFSIGLCVALLWDRFVNQHGDYAMVESCFFVVGIYLLMIAWFQYLKLDGVNPHFDRFIQRIPRLKKRHRSKDIVDFVDEKIISFDELDDDEQIVATLGSNVLAAVCFLILSGIAWIL